MYGLNWQDYFKRFWVRLVWCLDKKLRNRNVIRNLLKCNTTLVTENQCITTARFLSVWHLLALRWHFFLCEEHDVFLQPEPLKKKKPLHCNLCTGVFDPPSKSFQMLSSDILPVQSPAGGGSKINCLRFLFEKSWKSFLKTLMILCIFFRVIHQNLQQIKETLVANMIRFFFAVVARLAHLLCLPIRET